MPTKSPGVSRLSASLPACATVQPRRPTPPTPPPPRRPRCNCKSGRAGCEEKRLKSEGGAERAGWRRVAAARETPSCRWTCVSVCLRSKEPPSLSSKGLHTPSLLLFPLLSQRAVVFVNSPTRWGALLFEARDPARAGAPTSQPRREAAVYSCAVLVKVSNLLEND